jgi:cell division protein ZapE
VTARAEAALAAHSHALDESQRGVLGRLEDLRRRVLARNSVLSRGLRLLPRAPQPLRGLYLWGGVGRGKTFLVDEFFAELPVREKRREHFHRFMLDVHARLRRHRNLPEPLAQVAGDIAAKTRVLCIDEFVVGDIADAMILGTLLEAIFRRGVTLVATSNLPPGELYRGGLQRDRFLPAIALIEKHCRVMELNAGVDYRLRQLERATLFLGPAISDAEALMTSEFARLADGRGAKDVRVQVEGRAVRSRREAEDVVWFDFRELCEGPRSAADYIEIARCYQTVFLSGVPATRRAASSRWSTSSTIAASSSCCQPPRIRPKRSIAAKGSRSSSAGRRAVCTRCRDGSISRSRIVPERPGATIGR